MATEINNPELGNEDKGQDNNKTYTQAELDTMLQRETDRRVTEALKKREKDTTVKIKEAEKLARMNADEKAEYDKKAFESQLEEREKELNIRENKIEGLKILSEKGIPATLIDFVIDTDADTMNERIKALDKEIKRAVAEQVKAKLASPNPKVASATNGDITKDQFKKMNVNQRTELYRSNPELYKTLSK